MYNNKSHDGYVDDIAGDNNNIDADWKGLVGDKQIYNGVFEQAEDDESGSSKIHVHSDELLEDIFTGNGSNKYNDNYNNDIIYDIISVKNYDDNKDLMDSTLNENDINCNIIRIYHTLNEPGCNKLLWCCINMKINYKAHNVNNVNELNIIYYDMNKKLKYKNGDESNNQSNENEISDGIRDNEFINLFIDYMISIGECSENLKIYILLETVEPLDNYINNYNDINTQLKCDKLYESSYILVDGSIADDSLVVVASHGKLVYQSGPSINALSEYELSTKSNNVSVICIYLFNGLIGICNQELKIHLVSIINVMNSLGIMNVTKLATGSDLGSLVLGIVPVDYCKEPKLDAVYNGRQLTLKILTNLVYGFIGGNKVEAYEKVEYPLYTLENVIRIGLLVLVEEIHWHIVRIFGTNLIAGATLIVNAFSKIIIIESLTNRLIGCKNEIILFNEVRRSVIITLGKMVNYTSKRSLFEKLSLNDQDNMLVFVIDILIQLIHIFNKSALEEELNDIENVRIYYNKYYVSNIFKLLKFTDSEEYYKISLSFHECDEPLCYYNLGIICEQNGHRNEESLMYVEKAANEESLIGEGLKNNRFGLFSSLLADIFSNDNACDNENDNNYENEYNKCDDLINLNDIANDIFGYINGSMTLTSITGYGSDNNTTETPMQSHTNKEKPTLSYTTTSIQVYTTTETPTQSHTNKEKPTLSYTKTINIKDINDDNKLEYKQQNHIIEIDICNNINDLMKINNFIKNYGYELNILSLICNDNHLYLTKLKYGNYVIQFINKNQWHSNLSQTNDIFKFDDNTFIQFAWNQLTIYLSDNNMQIAKSGNVISLTNGKGGHLYENEKESLDYIVNVLMMSIINVSFIISYWNVIKQLLLTKYIWSINCIIFGINNENIIIYGAITHMFCISNHLIARNTATLVVKQLCGSYNQFATVCIKQKDSLNGCKLVIDVNESICYGNGIINSIDYDNKLNIKLCRLNKNVGNIDTIMENQSFMIGYERFINIQCNLNIISNINEVIDELLRGTSDPLIFSGVTTDNSHNNNNDNKRLIICTDDSEILIFEGTEFSCALDTGYGLSKFSIIPYSKGFIIRCDHGTLLAYECNGNNTKNDIKEIYKQINKLFIGNNNELIGITNWFIPQQSEEQLACIMLNNQIYSIDLLQIEAIKNRTDSSESNNLNSELLLISFHHKDINGIDICTRKLYLVTCGILYIICFSLLAIVFIILISETNDNIRVWIQQSESELNAFVSDEINTALYNWFIRERICRMNGTNYIIASNRLIIYLSDNKMEKIPTSFPILVTANSGRKKGHSSENEKELLYGNSLNKLLDYIGINFIHNCLLFNTYTKTIINVLIVSSINVLSMMNNKVLNEVLYDKNKFKCNESELNNYIINKNEWININKIFISQIMGYNNVLLTKNEWNGINYDLCTILNDIIIIDINIVTDDYNKDNDNIYWYIINNRNANAIYDYNDNLIVTKLLNNGNELVLKNQIKSKIFNQCITPSIVFNEELLLANNLHINKLINGKINKLYNELIQFKSNVNINQSYYWKNDKERVLTTLCDKFKQNNLIKLCGSNSPSEYFGNLSLVSLCVEFAMNNIDKIGYDSQHFEMKFKMHNIFIIIMYHIYDDNIIILGELSHPYLVIRVILQVLVVLIATFILPLQIMDGNIGLQLVCDNLQYIGYFERRISIATILLYVAVILAGLGYKQLIKPHLSNDLQIMGIVIICILGVVLLCSSKRYMELKIICNTYEEMINRFVDGRIYYVLGKLDKYHLMIITLNMKIVLDLMLLLLENFIRNGNSIDDYNERKELNLQSILQTSDDIEYELKNKFDLLTYHKTHYLNDKILYCIGFDNTIKITPHCKSTNILNLYEYIDCNQLELIDKQVDKIYDSSDGIDRCHDTFELINTWIAILAIVFDLALFSLFCSKWYLIMLIFMEKMVTSLLAQFLLVIMGILSCVIDATAHMILLYSNVGHKETFDAFLAIPSFVLILDIYN